MSKNDWEKDLQLIFFSHQSPAIGFFTSYSYNHWALTEYKVIAFKSLTVETFPLIVFH